MKYLKSYNESIRDKMTGISDDTVEEKLDKMWNKLLNSFKEEYSKRKKWDDVYYFLGFKQQDIEELFLNGWSLDEVYSEYEYKIDNYLDDLEDEIEYQTNK